MRGRLLLVHIWKLGHDQLVAVFGVITTQLNYIVVAFLNILRTPDWSKTEILSSISVELSWVESSDHSARRAVITLKAWSQRPIRLNSTQLASRVELSWVESSRIVRVITARRALWSLLRPDSTQLDWIWRKYFSFWPVGGVLNMFTNSTTRWVESDRALWSRQKLRPTGRDPVFSRGPI